MGSGYGRPPPCPRPRSRSPYGGGCSRRSWRSGRLAGCRAPPARWRAAASVGGGRHRYSCETAPSTVRVTTVWSANTVAAWSKIDEINSGVSIIRPRMAPSPLSLFMSVLEPVPAPRPCCAGSEPYAPACACFQPHPGFRHRIAASFARLATAASVRDHPQTPKSCGQTGKALIDSVPLIRRCEKDRRPLLPWW